MGTNGEELAQRETELLDPRTRSSRARLLQILSPDFIEVGASGETLRREDVIAALGRESPTRRWIEDLNIHTVATGVALVRCQAYRQLPGEQDAAESLRTSLWRQEGGNWRLLYHQGTPVPSPSARIPEPGE